MYSIQSAQQIVGQIKQVNILDEQYSFQHAQTLEIGAMRQSKSTQLNVLNR